MNQKFNIIESSNNSVDLFSFINVSMKQLREKGHTPHQAILLMAGVEAPCNQHIDWLDAQIFVFLEIKESVIERRVIYDA